VATTPHSRCCEYVTCLCVQLKGSPLPQVLKEDGAITAHADDDWISAEDVSECFFVLLDGTKLTPPPPPAVGDVAA
jgi:hypothetical protein